MRSAMVEGPNSDIFSRIRFSVFLRTHSGSSSSSLYLVKKNRMKIGKCNNITSSSSSSSLYLVEKEPSENEKIIIKNVWYPHQHHHHLRTSNFHIRFFSTRCFWWWWSSSWSWSWFHVILLHFPIFIRFFFTRYNDDDDDDDLRGEISGADGKNPKTFCLACKAWKPYATFGRHCTINHKENDSQDVDEIEVADNAGPLPKKSGTKENLVEKTG